MRYLLMLFTLSVSIGLAAPQDGAADSDEARKLREQLASQDARIEELRKEIAEQSKTLKELAAKTEVQAAKTESVSKGLGGFQFSGDFRLRLDAQVRSANEVAAPLQNVRGRYRVRLNIDKQIDPRFKFHLQLSTGALNNGLTNDQDMAGLTTKHPFSISEAYAKFQPTENITLRGGRMDEVFADNMRFLWDDDVRFNGFDQTMKVPFGHNSLGFNSIEFRMSEYILTNPAVYILSSTSPYVSAGYEVGQKVRDSMLFHPGVVLKGELTPAW
ncbi:MAG: putative porin, partial [Bryobacteraceae bacterium]